LTIWHILSAKLTKRPFFRLVFGDFAHCVSDLLTYDHRRVFSPVPHIKFQFFVLETEVTISCQQVRGQIKCPMLENDREVEVIRMESRLRYASF